MKKKVPFRDYILFVEAWYFLALARLILVFVPFRKILPLLGEKNILNNNAPIAIVPSAILARLSISILRACIRSPWRTKCFEQALAAKMMLKRRKVVSIIYFGVCKSTSFPDKLNAHAWLECDGSIVTGYKNVHTYKVISSFKS